jgi:hypothetical protein
VVSAEFLEGSPCPGRISVGVVELRQRDHRRLGPGGEGIFHHDALELLFHVFRGRRDQRRTVEDPGKEGVGRDSRLLHPPERRPGGVDAAVLGEAEGGCELRLSGKAARRQDDRKQQKQPKMDEERPAALPP